MTHSLDTGIQPPASAADRLQAPNTQLANPATFEQAFSRHHDTIFRYVASRVGSTAAEDVVHDTFEQAFAKRSSFDPTRADSPLPWLLGIATKRIGRHRNAERRWTQACIAEQSTSTPPSPSDDSHETQLDANASRTRLALAIAQLPRRERDAFLLHVLGELTYAEVATALEIPVGTVRSRISRGRERLATALEHQEHTP